MNTLRLDYFTRFNISYLAYNSVSRKINSTPTLRRRFTKAQSMQHSRIRNKCIRIEQQILEDYFDAGKSALEFLNSQEALEDPKPGNQQDGSETELLDLQEWIEMFETG